MVILSCTIHYVNCTGLLFICQVHCITRFRRLILQDFKFRLAEKRPKCHFSPGYIAHFEGLLASLFLICRILGTSLKSCRKTAVQGSLVVFRPWLLKAAERKEKALFIEKKKGLSFCINPQEPRQFLCPRSMNGE